MSSIHHVPATFLSHPVRCRRCVKQLVCAVLACMVAAVCGDATIPLAPIAADELPAAITGAGGPLRGVALNYHAADSTSQGYLAVPAGAGPFPAVILIHEWDGLVERVKQTADAFAAEGYVALAADLYSGSIGTNREENLALVRESLADPDAVIANLESAVRYLKARADTTGKVAAIGWCYGGGVALSFALGSQAHDGTAIFYGRLLDDPERMRHIHHEIYGTFARGDPGIPDRQVEAFVAALRAAGIAEDVHVYDHVQHGFWLYVDRDPAVNTAAALDAWQRLKAYLERSLGRAQD
jgi:carboxymethylenebutenolidase